MFVFTNLGWLLAKEKPSVDFTIAPVLLKKIL